MADINEFNSNAGDVVTGVEVVKKSKTGLIIGGIAVLTAGAIAGVAGGGIAAYCLSDFVKNQVKLRVSSPESYYAWVYEKNADAAAKQISTVYAKGLDKLEAGQQTKLSLRYDVTDEAKNFIIDELDLDRDSRKDERLVVDKFKNITIGADGSSRDSIVSGKAYVDWNDERLVTADIATDNSTMDYFVRIPELSEQWLAVEAEKLIEQNSYSDSEQEVIEAYKKAAQDPRSVISPEEIEELANRYIKVWNESIDDVKLEKKQTVTINDIDMNYTVVSVELTNKKINEIGEKILTTAKEDKLLKEIVVDRLHQMDADEFEEHIDDSIEDLKEATSEDDDTIVTYDTYIDAKGVIRGLGFKTNEENEEFLAIIGKDGEKVRGKCYLYDGYEDPEFSIFLNAEESGKKYSGTIDCVIDDDESWSLEFNDFEIINEEYGYFNVNTTLNIKDNDDEIAIPLDFSTDGESQSVAGDIIIEGTNYGTLTLTVGLKTGAEPTLPSKNSAYIIDDEDKADEFWRDYVSQDQMEKFLTDLFEKLGIDKNDASAYAKDSAEDMYFDWGSYYDDDDDDYGWDSDNDDDIDDDDLDDDDFDYDFDYADGPSVEDGQAYIMVYDKDMNNCFYGYGSDYLSYGAKFADIKGDGTYTVSVSADTPEFREHSSAMPNGISLLMLGCEGTKGAENAKVEITSLDIDGKTYTISKDMTVETADDYFAALIYTGDLFAFDDEDGYIQGVDLSGVQTWKTITITFKITGMK